MATVENNVAVSLKTKHVTRLWPCITLLGIYSRDMIVCVQTKTYRYVYSSIIRGSPQMETTQISFSR